MKDKHFVQGIVALLAAILITVIPFIFSDQTVTDELKASLRLIREGLVAYVMWHFAKSKSLTNNEEDNGQ